jgi:hypothetical protein
LKFLTAAVDLLLCCLSSQTSERFSPGKAEVETAINEGFLEQLVAWRRCAQFLRP